MKTPWEATAELWSACDSDVGAVDCLRGLQGLGLPREGDEVSQICEFKAMKQEPATPQFFAMCVWHLYGRALATRAPRRRE